MVYDKTKYAIMNPNNEINICDELHDQRRGFYDEWENVTTRHCKELLKTWIQANIKDLFNINDLAYHYGIYDIIFQHNIIPYKYLLFVRARTTICARTYNRFKILYFERC